jgi:hypothetical protein
MELGSQTGAAIVLPPNEERSERLMYLADMLGELQGIAAREGCVTLAGLLALSHVEAQRQTKTDATSIRKSPEQDSG